MVEEKRFEDKFNIMIIGDIDVGKTTILESYFNTNKNVTEETLTNKKVTIGNKIVIYLKGVDNFSKIVKIDNKNYLIKFWDTAGQEKYTNKLTSNYFHLAHGFILVFALNCKKSFDNLNYWLNVINETNSKQLHFIILCNKSDLIDKIEVSKDEIYDKKMRLGIDIFETSALKNIGIDEAINTIIQKIHKSVYEGEEQTSHGISIEDKLKSKSQSVSKCCKN